MILQTTNVLNFCVYYTNSKILTLATSYSENCLQITLCLWAKTHLWHAFELPHKSSRARNHSTARPMSQNKQKPNVTNHNFAIMQPRSPTIPVHILQAMTPIFLMAKSLILLAWPLNCLYFLKCVFNCLIYSNIFKLSVHWNVVVLFCLSSCLDLNCASLILNDVFSYVTCTSTLLDSKSLSPAVFSSCKEHWIASMCDICYTNMNLAW